MRFISLSTVALGILGVALSSCSMPTPSEGPDKQFAGTLEGAATGAGAGAITGLQVGAGTGPGALVGAGLGAVAGGIQGLLQDQAEEDMLRMAAETDKQRAKAQVHEILYDHYKRRIELHPAREIFPADIFFDGDEVKLRPGAQALVDEIARLNKRRYPWSRLVVAVYAKAKDENSGFAEHLTRKRSRNLADALVEGGIEPRRLETRSVIISEPILIDPADKPGRYSQAVELIPVDR